MAPKKRKVDNLLALAVLSTVYTRPMHRYEMASIMKARGKDQQMDIKWGSLYTVVQSMVKQGLLEIIGSQREGARPERVIYQITDAGRAEMFDWTRELIGTPHYEHPRFEAGLSLLMTLAPSEVRQLLHDRLAGLQQMLANQRNVYQTHRTELPRLFLVENEFSIAILAAEANWVQTLLTELDNDSFDDLAMWDTWHRTGAMPDDIAELAERGSIPD